MISDRPDDAGELGLRAGPFGHRRPRPAGADREPLEQARGQVRRADARSSRRCRRSPARCGRRTRTRWRSCRPATPGRCPAPRRTAARGRTAATCGMVSGGNPWGSTPTRLTPWSARLKTVVEAIASTTMISTAGTFGSQRCSTRISTIPAIPTAAAAATASPWARPLTNPVDLADEVVGVDLEPEQLGQLADQDGQRQAVHVADHRRLGDQVGDEPELGHGRQDHDRADHEREHRRQRDRPLGVAVGARPAAGSSRRSSVRARSPGPAPGSATGRTPRSRAGTGWRCTGR